MPFLARRSIGAATSISYQHCIQSFLGGEKDLGAIVIIAARYGKDDRGVRRCDGQRSRLKDGRSQSPLSS